MVSDNVKSGRINGTGVKGLSLSLKYIFVPLGTLHDLPCLYSSSQTILKLSPSAREHFMTLIEIVVLLITWTYLSEVALCKIYLIYFDGNDDNECYVYFKFFFTLNCFRMWEV